MTETELFGQAAAGSALALSILSEMAMEAGADGFVREIEALAAAEMCARLAAACGDVAENEALADILEARAAFEQREGTADSLRWYQGEAQRVRDAIAGSPVGNVASLRDPSLAGAAAGDVGAIDGLRDQAVRFLADCAIDPIEHLVAAELHGRLAASDGDADRVRRLAGILLVRAGYEYGQRNPNVGNTKQAEAICLLASLSDAGVAEASGWVATLIHESETAAILAAAAHRPSLLEHIQSGGNC